MQNSKQKYIKFGIIFLIILIIGLVVKFVFESQTKDKIFDYVEQEGYVLNQYGLYEKTSSVMTKEDYDYYVSSNQKAEYTKDTFDPANFQMIRNTYEYQDKLTSNLVATYDYKDKTLIYTYRVEGDNVNIVYMGNYNQDKFTCEKGVSVGVNINSDTVVCKKIELSILNFNLESLTFFKNANLANYMAKQEDK